MNHQKKASVKSRNLFFVFTLLLLLPACGEKAFFDDNREISPAGWSWQDPVTFEVEVDDTLNPYHFFLNLRTTKAYEYSNIYVFFTTQFPDGRTARDTVECPLSDDYGNWLGKTSGSLVDNRILFGIRRIFPQRGTYHFVIEQAMRDQDLTEVVDVGLRIEKSKN